MKVKELISYLKDFDPNDEVYYLYPAHDYWKATLAAPVSTIDEAQIKHSEYYRAQQVIDDDDVTENTRTVVLITGEL